jgi:hypothetical protein
LGGALVVGFALSGAAFAAQLLLFGWTGPESDVLLLVLGALWWWRGRFAAASRCASGAPGAARATSPLPRWWATAATALAGIVVAALFVRHSLRYPDGGWDARAIWNLRARALFGAPHDLALVFSAAVPHGDYPPLLPALIAHGWFALHSRWLPVQAIVAAVFAAGGALVLFRRSREAALLLLATPLFLTLAWNQYADLKLAMLLLVALTLSHEGRLEAAGLAAGLAALTKNEGLFEALALAAAVVWVRGWRDLWRFCAGAAAPIAFLAWFKLRLAPQNDLAAIFSFRRAFLHAPLRVPRVLAAFLKQVVSFEGFGAAAAAAAVVWMARFARRPRRTLPIRFAGLSLALVFCIYVFTPQPLEWHLRGSVDRVLFQIWPCLLFATSLLWEPNAPN